MFNDDVYVQLEVFGDSTHTGSHKQCLQVDVDVVPNVKVYHHDIYCPDLVTTFRIYAKDYILYILKEPWKYIQFSWSQGPPN